ncbi:MAG: hypothetical protein FI707_05435 [SAR202 cluster bacterium]|nr:hypothetical protein [SAR202 cluster bacterium]HAL47997.1 hypothetical protein [Dehalococcoidia bacterium]MDP6662721.1 hypothetical protein [SAR202 cluster bacterium]MDP6801150.1 hypothetical protein [SAR202 cluster bacterium]MQG58846.1 hypothetical protein [SAR202 cluster bacterium]
MPLLLRYKRGKMRDNGRPIFTKEELKKIIEDAGGPAAIYASLKIFTERSNRMFAAMERLTEQYPHKWGSILDNGELCIGDTRRDVMDQLEKAGQTGTPVIKYLDPDPPLMII